MALFLLAVSSSEFIGNNIPPSLARLKKKKQSTPKSFCSSSYNTFFLPCSSFKEYLLQFQPFFLNMSDQRERNERPMEGERLPLER